MGKQEKVHRKYTISVEGNRIGQSQTEKYCFNALVKGKRVIDRCFQRCNEIWEPNDRFRRDICCISPEQASVLSNGGVPAGYLESLVGKNAIDYQQIGGILIKISSPQEGRFQWERLGVVTNVK